ncbi:MAG: Rhomboid family protein, partial [uncultured Nocardioides sp.]
DHLVPRPRTRLRLGHSRDLDPRVHRRALDLRDRRHGAREPPRRGGDPPRQHRRAERDPRRAAPARRVRAPGGQHGAGPGAGVPGAALGSTSVARRDRDRVGRRWCRHLALRWRRHGAPRRVRPRLRLVDLPGAAGALHPQRHADPGGGLRVPHLRRAAPRRAARPARDLLAGAPVRSARGSAGGVVAAGAARCCGVRPGPL